MVDQLMTCARHPGCTQDRFHLRLVADVPRRLRVHAIDAEHLPGHGQRFLQLLQRTHQAIDPTDLPGQPLDGGDDLLRIERIVDPPVPAQQVRQPIRELIGRRRGDDGDPDTGQFRSRPNEPRRGLEQKRGDERGNDHAPTLVAITGRAQRHVHVRPPPHPRKRSRASSDDTPHLLAIRED